MIQRDTFEKLVDNINEVLDWWEFDGSPIKGDEIMEKLNIIYTQAKSESKQCQTTKKCH